MSALASRLTSSQTGGNAVADKYVTLGYNQLDQVTSLDRYANTSGSGNLVAHTDYVRDNLGRITSLDHSKGTTHLATYTPTYDARGRVSAMDDVFSNSAWNEQHGFTYDDDDQLLTADHSVQSDESYAYDANGNRSGSQTHVGSTSSSTVTANNRISTDGVYNYTWDAEGNLATKTEIATGIKQGFTWDHRNRVRYMDFKNSSGTILKTITYRWDYNDQLIRRTETPYSGGVAQNSSQIVDDFVQDHGQTVLAFRRVGSSGAVALTDRYLWTDVQDQLVSDEQVTSLASAGTVYWNLEDQLGNVRDLATYNAGADTTTIAKYRRFDSFGNVTYDSASSVVEVFGYASGFTDSATGIVQFDERGYDPQLGRPIAEDPIRFAAGDSNLGRWVGNHPTYATDPTGLKPTIPLTKERLEQVALSEGIISEWDDQNTRNQKIGAALESFVSRMFVLPKNVRTFPASPRNACPDFIGLVVAWNDKKVSTYTDAHFIEVKALRPMTITLAYEQKQAKRYIDVLANSSAKAHPSKPTPILSYVIIDGVKISDDVYAYAAKKGVKINTYKISVDDEGRLYLNGFCDTLKGMTAAEKYGALAKEAMKHFFEVSREGHGKANRTFFP